MKCLLFVEDEPALLDLWVEVAERAGYRAVGVPRAADAMAMAKRVRPDLVLLDFIMPRREPDGFDFLSRLRKDAALGSIPVVMVSGLAAAVNPEAARHFGVRRILAKPITPEALLAEVESVLGAAGRNLERRPRAQERDDACPARSTSPSPRDHEGPIMWP